MLQRSKGSTYFYLLNHSICIISYIKTYEWYYGYYEWYYEVLREATRHYDTLGGTRRCQILLGTTKYYELIRCHTSCTTSYESQQCVLVLFGTNFSVSSKKTLSFPIYQFFNHKRHSRNKLFRYHAPVFYIILFNHKRHNRNKLFRHHTNPINYHLNSKNKDFILIHTYF